MSFDDIFQTRLQHENFVRDIIETGTLEGLSGNQILANLSAAGAGINRNRFFELRREVLELFKYQEQISALGDNRVVPATYHATVPGQPYNRNFTYRFQVTVKDLTTGETRLENWQIGVDEFTTVGELKQEILDSVADSPKDIIQIDMVAATVNPGVF